MHVTEHMHLQQRMDGNDLRDTDLHKCMRERGDMHAAKHLFMCCGLEWCDVCVTNLLLCLR